MDFIESHEALRRIYKQPGDKAVRKELKGLDAHCRSFIAHSPFVLIGSSDGNGNADVTPKGDKPGFAAVLDQNTIAIPDRPGNNRLDTLENILANPALNGKTVVMVWEHKHIANEKLETSFEGEQVTLRQLFKLDILPGVPKTWPTDTYDYFWIVDFPDNSNVPSKFSMVKQEFGASFPKVPSNDWGAPDGLDAASGCKLSPDDEE